MSISESWQVVTPLDTIKAVMSEVADWKKSALHVYFRVPFVTDSASGCLKLLAPLLLVSVLATPRRSTFCPTNSSRKEDAVCVAKTRGAILEQNPYVPGYKGKSVDGKMFLFGFECLDLLGKWLGQILGPHLVQAPHEPEAVRFLFFPTTAYPPSPGTPGLGLLQTVIGRT